MIVVYLSNQQIKVVLGRKSGNRLNVSKMLYTVDTNDCILNGTITDKDEFTRIIGELWEVNKLPKKDIFLVVNGNQFSTKKTEVPVQNTKKTLDFLKREFTDAGRLANPVFHYFSLNTNTDKRKIDTVYSIAAPRDYLLELMEVFNSLGLKVVGISDAASTVIRAVPLLPSLRGQTVVLQFIDGITLLNILFIKGKYEYSNHTRLFQTPGTPEFALEIAGTAENLMQFARANALSDNLKKLYVAGFGDEMFEVYKENLKTAAPQLTVLPLLPEGVVNMPEKSDGMKTFSNFALPIAGLGSGSDRRNIISNVRYDTGGRHQKGRRLITLAAATFLIVIAIIGLLQWNVMANQNELKELKAFNENTELSDKLASYDEKQKNNQALKTIINGILETERTVMSYPKVDSEVGSIIEESANGLVTAKIRSYDSASGILTFDTSAKNVADIHKFAERLSEKDIFKSVDYSGYTQNQADGEFSVKVTCIMEERQVEGIEERTE